METNGHNQNLQQHRRSWRNSASQAASVENEQSIFWVETLHQDWNRRGQKLEYKRSPVTMRGGVVIVLWLALTVARSEEENKTTTAPQDNSTTTSDWGIGSIRDGFETVNGYFDSFLELLGGRNGVCQYKCRYGKAPLPRPDYKTPEPNGCSSSFLGLKLDLGIPAMTKCCNQLDLCYDTCGANKYRCDAKFRWCLYGICSDLKKSLGFVSKVEACETVADTMFNAVWTLGCRPFMNSQRSACTCAEEERDEL
ncbi:group XIIB secretory phospholipase A2-like protein isoform X2 [Hypanus sabinus]|uniref:group XIIB secretory phospholipase A2-like protein isoform X2 n=1 Tax=Hypanus sabinus TaxID=79690 RepID=UPI0028C430A7|nr:group XIIB secretory phospholipase A2-like protein isoform X2 [Hypanus sabinus]